jgi:hypothetical protein
MRRSASSAVFLVVSPQEAKPSYRRPSSTGRSALCNKDERPAGPPPSIIRSRPPTHIGRPRTHARACMHHHIIYLSIKPLDSGTDSRRLLCSTVLLFMTCYAQYRPVNMNSADLLWTRYVLFLCTRDPLCIVTRPVTFARAKHRVSSS